MGKHKCKEKFFVIKTSLQAIGWSNKHKDTLEHLVCETHNLTVHTYQLAHWIFMAELDADQSFDLNDCVNEVFFHEAFLHLTNRVAGHMKIEARIHTQQLVQRYLASYQAAVQPETVKFANYTQIVNYAAMTIKTAYLNNVILRFGNHL
ncbi:hypothetical protein EV175_004786 [Coemansia sp. RSA 1933]|nr:hypothetical protein EV175_004786 [Coemansia sp. RSA 1933]